MTKYWRIYKPEHSYVTKYYTCNVCKFFHVKENQKKAHIELKGISDDPKQYTEGQLIRLCKTHFEELKQAGEVEA